MEANAEISSRMSAAGPVISGLPWERPSPVVPMDVPSRCGPALKSILDG